MAPRPTCRTTRPACSSMPGNGPNISTSPRNATTSEPRARKPSSFSPLVVRGAGSAFAPDLLAPQPSLVSQCLNRVQLRSPGGRVNAEEQADGCRHSEREDDRGGGDERAQGLAANGNGRQRVSQPWAPHNADGTP